MAAAYGGGGLGVLSAGAFGLIRAEAALARRAIGEPTGEPPSADGVYGAHHEAEPLTLALLGDSSAAGLGVDHPHQTPGAMLAAGLARVRRPAGAAASARPWSARRAATWPSRSTPSRADVAGRRGDHDRRQRRHPPGQAADAPSATSTTPSGGCARSAPRSSSAPAPTSARSSRSPSRCAGSPAGRAASWPPPRRSSSSRRAAARCRSATCSGPEFAASPKEMFGPDRFHPSPAGYASAAAALLPVGVRGAGRVVRRRGRAGAGPDPRRGRPPDRAGRRRGRRRAGHRGRRRPGRRARPRAARPLGAAAAPARPRPAARSRHRGGGRARCASRLADCGVVTGQ